MESENNETYQQSAKPLLIYGLIGGTLGTFVILLCIYIVSPSPIQLQPTHIFIIIFFTLLCGLATIAGGKNNLGKVISTLLDALWLI
jgi:ABC-type antimicrobial peptide transport system permease subunit